MVKKKISDFANKPTPVSPDLFLIEDGTTGTYYNVTKAQLAAILGGSQSLQDVITVNEGVDLSVKPIIFTNGGTPGSNQIAWVVKNGAIHGADQNIIAALDSGGEGYISLSEVANPSGEQIIIHATLGMNIKLSDSSGNLFEIDRVNDIVKYNGVELSTTKIGSSINPTFTGTTKDVGSTIKTTICLSVDGQVWSKGVDFTVSGSIYTFINPITVSSVLNISYTF